MEYKIEYFYDLPVDLVQENLDNRSKDGWKVHTLTETASTWTILYERNRPKTESRPEPNSSDSNLKKEALRIAENWRRIAGDKKTSKDEARALRGCAIDLENVVHK